MATPDLKGGPPKLTTNLSADYAYFFIIQIPSLLSNWQMHFTAAQCFSFYSVITGNPVDGDLTSYRSRESDLYRKLFTPESDDYDRGVRPPGLENAGRFTMTINKVESLSDSVLGLSLFSEVKRLRCLF